MAAGNQGQGHRNEGHDRNNGGKGAGGQAQGAGTGGHAQGAGTGGQTQVAGLSIPQGVTDATSRVREGFDTAKDEAARRLRRVEGTAARNPGSSVLIGFGIGFGIGVALASMLSQHEETWAEKYLPDSLRNLPDSLHNVRVPKEVRDLPDTLHGRLDHLTDSLRDLPSLLAKAVRR